MVLAEIHLAQTRWYRDRQLIGKMWQNARVQLDIDGVVLVQAHRRKLVRRDVITGRLVGQRRRDAPDAWTLCRSNVMWNAESYMHWQKVYRDVCTLRAVMKNGINEVAAGNAVITLDVEKFPSLRSAFISGCNLTIPLLLAFESINETNVNRQNCSFIAELNLIIFLTLKYHGGTFRSSSIFYQVFKISWLCRLVRKSIRKFVNPWNITEH